MCTEYSNNIELLYLFDIIVIKKQTIVHTLKQRHNLMVKRGNQFSSVQLFSHVWLFETPWTAAHQLPCPSPTSGDYLNSCPLSWWCHPTISSSVVPFSFRLQSFPASGSFPISQLFASGGQSTGASASASVLSMNIQGWFPLWWTGLISLLSKGLSVFSSITIQKHHFFHGQPSSWSNFHIHTWLLEKPQLWLHGALLAKWYLCFWITV